LIPGFQYSNLKGVKRNMGSDGCLSEDIAKYKG